MQHLEFRLVFSGFKTGILAVAVSLQLLPFFFFLVVVAHALGASGAGLLVAFPLFILAMIFGVCWLTSKHGRHRYAWPPSELRRTTLMPVRNRDVLIKTRDERYEDLKDVFMGDRR